MKIYVGHSSSFDYKQDLYKPLKNSELSADHELIFPHENSEELFNSREFLREEADVMIAEVSNPSTGLGVELGWADQFDVSIICVCQKDSQPSSALKAVTDDVLVYENSSKLVKVLEKALQN